MAIRADTNREVPFRVVAHGFDPATKQLVSVIIKIDGHEYWLTPQEAWTVGLCATKDAAGEGEV
jgi:hypothetical protein